MIPFLDIQKINLNYQTEIEQELLTVFRSGWYILGDQVKLFETNLSKYLNAKHVIGVANGLDALKLIIKAYLELGVFNLGDHIIVPANTYIASVLSITDNGLQPIFVEPDTNTYNIDITQIEAAITPKTKAIMIVHLYGRAVFGNQLVELAQKYNLQIIEDNAQAIGASYNNIKTGTLAHAGAFSFYPSKNLGAIGDAGAVVTNNDLLASTIRTLANYGSQQKYTNKYQGINSRLDEIQAAVLNVKLKYLDSENAKRQAIALQYIKQIKNSKIILPNAPKNKQEHVWHLFVIQTVNRADLQNYLLQNNIQTVIHYPIAPHKQACYSQYNSLSLPLTELIHQQVLSLPISPVLDPSQVNHIINTINCY